MIITRRFFACTQRIGGKGITIDVRTSANVSEAQAQANAEGLALRKLKAKSVFVESIPYVENVKPNCSIGPKATRAKSQQSSPILVTVSGGVAEVVPETVPAGIAVEIIDYDNLKDGGATELAKLSKTARAFVAKEKREAMDAVASLIYRVRKGK